MANPYVFRGITLPEHLQESLDAYVSTGRPVGGFLEAVLSNNLFLAFNRADEQSAAAMPAIVAYLYNKCPGPCWGNSDRYALWISKKRQEREAQHA